MGKKFRNKQKNKMGKRGTWSDSRAPQRDIKRENSLMRGTYEGLGILPEDELEKLWEYLGKDLRNSWRFTSGKESAKEALKVFIERYLSDLSQQKEVEPQASEDPVAVEASSVELPRQHNWYPGGLAWDHAIPKAVIRKHRSFAAFQKFLVSETCIGNISRQEIVSMLPPLFLDVQKGMVVLDMCAAPGSKSAQLAEMIHGDLQINVDEKSNTDATQKSDRMADIRNPGLLIANDSDYKRAHMLTHQLKRLNLPNIIVTNNDAAIFPSIELPQESGSKIQLKYDRILADVPCSGDGTVRKNPGIWLKWNPRDGIGLHRLQRRILVRGLELLKVGGIMVYSTCSMNPIENESVVASAIQQCGGLDKIEIVDASDICPGVLRKPGLTTWKVFDRTQSADRNSKPEPIFWDTYEDYVNSGYKKSSGAEIERGMFPPDASLNLPLDRCMRIYAHQQDTGSFFITLLKKKSAFKATPMPAKPQSNGSAAVKDTESAPVPAEDTTNGEPVGQTDLPKLDVQSKKRPIEAEENGSEKRLKTDDVAAIEAEDVNAMEVEDSTKVDVEDGTLEVGIASPDVEGDTVEDSPADNIKEDNVPAVRMKKNREPQKECFTFLKPDDPALAKIYSWFDIADDFPRDNFLVRNADGSTSKAIYYASDLAKQILINMDNTGLKFVNAAIKMFVKHDTRDPNIQHCGWRVQSEGVHMIEPFCSKLRKIYIKERLTLRSLLVEWFPQFNASAERTLAEIYPQLVNADKGCYFLICASEKGQMDAFEYPMVFPLWYSGGSVNLMLAKEDRHALLLRLFGSENVEILNHVKEKDSNKHSAPAAQPAESFAAGEETKE